MGRVNRRIYATRRKRSPNKLWGGAMDHLNLTKKITGSTSEGGTARTTPFSIGGFVGGTSPSEESTESTTQPATGLGLGIGNLALGGVNQAKKVRKGGGAIAGAIQPVKTQTSTPTYLSDKIDSGSDNLAGNLTATVTIAKG